MASAQKSADPKPVRSACPSQERPVDLIHLAHQTMGDKDLEREVLQMFTRQARKSLQEIAGADPAAVSAAAHRLKGAAAAVGAFKVRAAAERLESAAGDLSARAALGATLGSAVLEAEDFILNLTR